MTMRTARWNISAARVHRQLERQQQVSHNVLDIIIISPPRYQNPHLGTFFRLEIVANQCEREVCVVNEAPVTSYTCVLPS